MAIMHTGIVLDLMELRYLVVHLITRTTTIIVALLCLQMHIIQMLKVVGHVMLDSSKSITCVFGGINFPKRYRELPSGSFLFAFSRFYLYFAGRSEYERSTCSLLRCVLSFHEKWQDPHIRLCLNKFPVLRSNFDVKIFTTTKDEKDYFFIFLLCLS